jgi:hypothetical protein
MPIMIVGGGPSCRSSAIRLLNESDRGIALNPLRLIEKGGFYTEDGQTDLRCVESGYAYKNKRLLAAEASPAIALGRQ